MSVLKYLTKISVFVFFTLISSSVAQSLEFPLQKMTRDKSQFQHISHLLSADSFIPSKLENTTIIDLTRIKDGLYTIKLAIGDPIQEFDVLVDTGSFLLWIASEECNNCYYNKHLLKQSISKTLKKEQNRMSLRYISGSIEGNQSKDKLKLHDGKSIPSFNFLLSDKVAAEAYIDGILGLARKYEPRYSLDFSLLDSLYKGQAIKRKVFTQLITENEIGSKFSFGDLPQEISDNMHKYNYCKTIDNFKQVETYWTCNLKQVLVRTNSETLAQNEEKKQVIELSNTNVPAIFDTGSNVIMAPPELFQRFKDVYFKQYLDNGTCKTIQDYSSSYGIQCKSDTDFETFPTILFVF